MSLWRRRTQPTAEQFVAERTGGRVDPAYVTTDQARRHSAVWACLRLRADLVSTMPIDAYRKVSGIDVEIPKPPMLITPGGDKVDINEWRFSSQQDLDSVGNTFGIISAKNANGLPARIDLVPTGEVSVQGKGGEIKSFQICGQKYAPDQVWHEKQYTISGVPVGLGPIGYAAATIASGLSAQRFAANWFTSGGVPAAILKNTAKTLSAAEADLAKQRFNAAMASNGVFTTGADWDYKMVAVPANQANFIEMMQYSVVDIARFLGCPADLIEAAVSGQSVTYANITQRNLQFLIMNLQPTMTRRETAWSRWLPRPQYVKLNPDALLRMDPATRTEVIGKRLASRTLTNSEARALENQSPLTEEQIAEFDKIYGPPTRPLGPAEAVQKAYLGVGTVITSDEARELVNAAGANLPIPGPSFESGGATS